MIKIENFKKLPANRRLAVAGGTVISSVHMMPAKIPFNDQRRRFALRRADRTKQIGRSETEILRRHWPAAGLPPHPGQAVLLADASLVLKPYLDSRTGRLRRPDSL